MMTTSLSEKKIYIHTEIHTFKIEEEFKLALLPFPPCSLSLFTEKVQQRM